MESKPELTCPHCGNTEFHEETGALSSPMISRRWLVKFYFCVNCGYVQIFSTR